ncbi:MAG: hypothetical protein WC588_04655 [Candidatus Micrarchaeia archaeon]
MFVEDKKNGGLFLETDPSLSDRFAEAGFGFKAGASRLFHPLEAAYLAKIGKSPISSCTPDSFILSQKKKDKAFPFAFAAYFTIRQTGRMVRPYANTGDFFRVYAPGVGREEGRPSLLVCLLPGKLPSVKSIEEKVKVAHLARLDLVIASGTEKELRFHKVAAFNF